MKLVAKFDPFAICGLYKWLLGLTYPNTRSLRLHGLRCVRSHTHNDLPLAWEIYPSYRQDYHIGISSLSYISRVSQVVPLVQWFWNLVGKGHTRNIGVSELRSDSPVWSLCSRVALCVPFVIQQNVPPWWQTICQIRSIGYCWLLSVQVPSDTLCVWRIIRYELVTLGFRLYDSADTLKYRRTFRCTRTDDCAL